MLHLHITHYDGKWTLRWVIILHKLDFFVNIVKVEFRYTPFPCFQLSLHLKCIQAQPLFFCHKRLWCNITLTAPWMERVALTAFICKVTWRLSSSHVQELKTSVLRALVFWREHQIYTNGEKKKKYYWQHPISFRLWSGANSSFVSVSCKCYSTICEKSHAGTNTYQSIRKWSMHKINPPLLETKYSLFMFLNLWA